MPTQLQDAVVQPIPQNPPTRKPGVFIVHGGDLHIIFAPSASDGRPRLEYRDSSRTLTFSGDQIRTLDTDIGTMVTVTIQLIPDVGNTSFTLIVPRVNLQSPEIQISTFGVTTHNRTPFTLIPDQGQAQTYKVKELHGVVQAAV